jgi:YVTN family beta-propeller protein
VTTGLCSSISFDCTRPESVYYAVWVIDTATNKVVSAAPGKGFVEGIAFSPDGKHTYFANYDSDVLLPQVLTDSGAVPLPGNGSVSAIAITPDGRDLYVPYVDFNGTSNPPETVAIIDTTMNSVKTVLVEPASFDTMLTGVCVTPDGKHVYVTNQASNTVSVIDTASNTIVKTVSVGAAPSGVAVTPDGLHVYVSNQGSDSVSVINTASNTVVDTILSVAGPSAISIMSRPLGIPFLVFDAKLNIDLDRQPEKDAFELDSSFILNSTGGNRIHPDTEPIKLQVGPFIASIPAGSFKRREGRSYTFEGVINGVHLRAKIELMGRFRYAFLVEAKGANLSGTTNPVQVSLGIGDNSGLTSVKAHFDRDHRAHSDWTDEWH